MYAILNRSIALRSWQLIPCAYIMRSSQTPKRLTRAEFATLLLADGLHDIPENDTAQQLIESGLMNACKKGAETLTPWQEYKSYDNRLVPAMNIQITGRCNFNCLHCFNAKDNHALQSHIELDQMIKLLDDAAACGIRAVTITGGEPMVHKNIREIIDAIYARDMYIFDFNTNGAYLTQEFLDYLKQFGIPPTMKISFDGIGYHDEIRGCIGAENSAMAAMELCIANGFPVMAQVNVNPMNLSSIPETLDRLDSMRVGTIRLIRTTEVPRWLANGGTCLDIKDYYDSMIDALANFVSKPRISEVIVWQLMQLSPHDKSYTLDAVQNIRLSQPVCKGNRSMIAIGANGNVYPCLQISGIMDSTGVSLGNVFETPLKQILQADSDYMKCVCLSVEKKAAINGKCSTCKYLRYCGTGCIAMAASAAFANRNEFCITDPDTWKCFFFDEGYYEKIKAAFPDYECASPLLED